MLFKGVYWHYAHYVAIFVYLTSYFRPYHLLFAIIFSHVQQVVARLSTVARVIFDLIVVSRTVDMSFV